MDGDANRSPEPLDYARPDADGLPDWVPEAEALIELREPPKSLRPLFRAPDDAMRYLSKAVARRNGIDRLEDCCIGCGQRHTPTYVQVEWYADLSPKFLDMKITYANAQAKFVTHHAMCVGCYSNWVSRYQIGAIGTWVSFFLSIGWIAILLLGSGGGLARRISFSVIVAVAVTAAAGFICEYVSRLLIRRSVPSAILDRVPEEIRFAKLGALLVR